MSENNQQEIHQNNERTSIRSHSVQEKNPSISFSQITSESSFQRKKRQSQLQWRTTIYILLLLMVPN
jgi:hypothetical protein